MPNCYGLVLKHKNKIILVRKANGWISFPKGGYENKTDKNAFDCALREFTEETRLTGFSFKYDPNLVIEYNEKGSISCSYYLGVINDDEKFIKLKNATDRYGKKCKDDSEEIEDHKWNTMEEIENLDPKMFIERRKEIAKLCFEMSDEFFTEKYSKSTTKASLVSKKTSILTPELKAEVKGIIFNNELKRPDELKLESVVKLSIACSTLLRHKLDEFESLSKDGSGYVYIDELIAKINHIDKKKRFPFKITHDMINYIVDTNDKKRMEVDGKRIRCSQGHSSGEIKDDMIYTEITEPLTKCYHVTDNRALQLIKKSGLNRMGRQKIHFAQDEHLLRKGRSVYIEVNMETAMKAGIKFHRSNNNVILSEGIDGVIPFEFLIIHT